MQTYVAAVFNADGGRLAPFGYINYRPPDWLETLRSPDNLALGNAMPLPVASRAALRLTVASVPVSAVTGMVGSWGSATPTGPAVPLVFKGPTRWTLGTPLIRQAEQYGARDLDGYLWSYTDSQAYQVARSVLPAGESAIEFDLRYDYKTAKFPGVNSTTYDPGRFWCGVLHLFLESGGTTENGTIIPAGSFSRFYVFYNPNQESWTGSLCRYLVGPSGTSVYDWNSDAERQAMLTGGVFQTLNAEASALVNLRVAARLQATALAGADAFAELSGTAVRMVASPSAEASASASMLREVGAVAVISPEAKVKFARLTTSFEGFVSLHAAGDGLDAGATVRAVLLLGSEAPSSERFLLIPLSALPELDISEVVGVSADIRKVLYGLIDGLYRAYAAKAVADRPSTMSIARVSRGSGSDDGSLIRSYTFTFKTQILDEETTK